MKRLITILCALISVSAAAQKYNDLANTPPMGWNSWNCFHCNIDEETIKGIADVMVSSGLAEAGYTYINMDDCWHGQRDADGFIQCDPDKFPSGIRALADYVHLKGLKLGIYSDAGTQTCGGRPGSLGHEYQDAIQYARWGIDYLKYDWCYTPDINARGAYKLMSDALKSTGRDIYFSMCEWGTAKPWEWASGIANSWRSTGDIGLTFNREREIPEYEHSILEILDMNAPLRKYAGPGHWNDPDMLEVGNGLTEAEDRAHFTLWCMMCAPLILGNDIRNMSEETKAIITNKEVIALNQDPLGVQALRHSTLCDGKVEVWFKPLASDKWAVCFLNRSTEDLTFNVNWQDYSFTDEEVSGLHTDFDTRTYTIRDLWAGKTLKVTTAAKRPLKVTVASHDVAVYRLD